jgi:dihydrofolate synthase/folylpolyglutamate synthase
MTISPNSNSALQQWLDYWNSIHVTAIDLGLERIRPVAEQLDILSPDAHVVTVAGTNGKGSTTTSIAAIYQAAGKTVGLYQSPHIYRFNERIKLNGVEIDDQTLIQAFMAVETARLATGLTLSFFEATTLAAFVAFKTVQVDVWVLEVGLGGRLDAVNLIDPDVAVITNIGLDHVEWLGDSIEKIAFEKAGIMRQGIPVVYSQANVPEAIITRSNELNCRLIVGERDYAWQASSDRSSFHYAAPACTLALDYPQLALVNVSAAITAVLAGPIKVTQQAIIQGIRGAYIAGRFEIRPLNNRKIILDVAHNVHGATFLIRQLEQYVQYQLEKPRIHVVFSMLADKDIQGVVNQLKDTVSFWHIAAMQNVARAATQDQLVDALEHQHSTTYDNIAQAFYGAMTQSQQYDIILVCGSFHTLEAVWESLASWQ